MLVCQCWQDMHYAPLLNPFPRSCSKASKGTSHADVNDESEKHDPVDLPNGDSKHKMDSIFDLMLQPLTVNFNKQSIAGTGRLLHDTELSTVYCFSHDALQPLTNPANSVVLPSRFLIKIYNDEECFHCEQQALDRLAPLQGNLVPTLYGEIQLPRFQGKRALALQYLNGGTLLSAIASRKITTDADLQTLQKAMSEASATLTAYHVQHNDLELKNLMIEQSDQQEQRLFVIDFGNSKLCTGEKAACECWMDPEDRRRCGKDAVACCECPSWECKCAKDCSCGDDCKCRKCACAGWNGRGEKAAVQELWDVAAAAAFDDPWEHKAPIMA